MSHINDFKKVSIDMDQFFSGKHFIKNTCNDLYQLKQEYLLYIPDKITQPLDNYINSYKKLCDDFDSMFQAAKKVQDKGLSQETLQVRNSLNKLKIPAEDKIKFLVQSFLDVDYNNVLPSFLETCKSFLELEEKKEVLVKIIKEEIDV